VVLGAGFFAGFVDSVVGGGGLIQIPALLSAFPTAPPAMLLGTSKLGSIVGTSNAVYRYSRRVAIPWRRLMPAAAVAFLAALIGAALVTHVSPALFRPVVPVVLALVLAYVLWRPDLGSVHVPSILSARRAATAIAGIAAIGLYDGFFGPGTGSFLMLLFVRLYGFDFINASAAARFVNVATNAGALLFFVLHRQIYWALALPLAVCNTLGSVLGSHTALKHGSRFVRTVFIAVVAALIVKTAWDALTT
jgi:uncharacterized membrane protein YfcA